MLFAYRYDISVVMGYYKRKPQLLKTLQYFNNNYTKYNYEVIIVDDNSETSHQLDDIVSNYNFPIKHVKISKEEKGDRINPCVTYNKGFNVAEGKRVIIQNPECIHVGDVMQCVMENLNNNDYIAFSCYNCLSQELTEELLGNSNLINDKSYTFRNTPEFKSHFKVITGTPWYNHPIHRPVHYHFCAAIMNDNLKMLGGFNEEFSDGHSYDDNEILLSIHYNLKLNIKTLDPNTSKCFVVHQWHARDAESKFTMQELKMKFNKNKMLYDNIRREHKKYHFNFPKLLHLYWDGSPFSYLNLLTVLSFNKHHTGWKINVFIPKTRNAKKSWNTDEQKTDYTGEDYFDKLKGIKNVNIHTIDTDILPFQHTDASEVIKSDFFRLYILNNIGGVWSDFDIIYTNNIERYYNKQKISREKNMIIYNYKDRGSAIYPVGMFISNKKNSVLSFILSHINKFYNPTDYQCLGCSMFMTLFTDYDNKLKRFINHDELYIDNADCYLKIKWNQLEYLYNKSSIKPELFENNNDIFGIHWFNGADMSKKYCNELNLTYVESSDYVESCLVDMFVKKYN